MNKLQSLSYQLTFTALIILALFLFTAFSLCSLNHILLIIPGIYFCFIDYQQNQLFKTAIERVLLGLIVVMILSVLANWSIFPKPWSNLFKIKYFIIALISLSAIRHTFNEFITEKHIKILTNLFVTSITLATMAGLIGYFTGFNPLKMKAVGQFRNSGMYGMVMSYAYGMAIVIPALIAAFKEREFTKKYINSKFLLVAIIINGIGIYLSYTRGAMLGLIVSLPFIFFFTNKKLFKYIAVFATLIMIAAVTVSVLKIDTGIYRFSGTKSNDIRMGLFKVTSKMFEQHPIVGIGFRNVEANVKTYRQQFKINDSRFSGHAHNNFMEFLAGTGIIGAILFILLLYYWYRNLSHQLIWPSQILLPSFVSFVVSGLFQSTIIDGENTFLILTLLALSSPIKLLKNQSETSFTL